MEKLKGTIKCKFRVNSVHIVVWNNPNPKTGELMPNVTFFRCYGEEGNKKGKKASGFRESDLDDLIDAIIKYKTNDYVDENKEEYKGR